MPVFIRLPDAVVIDIISFWLRFLDLGKIDSAFCTKLHRENVLTILSSIALSISVDQQIIFNLPSAVEWLIVRNVCLSSLFFIHRERIGLQFDFRLNLSKVSKISVHDNVRPTCRMFPESSLEKLINSCARLTELHLSSLSGISSQAFGSFDTSILKQMEILSISSCKCPTGSLLSLIFKCTSLKYLSLHQNAGQLSENQIVDLMLSTKVTKLHLDTTVSLDFLTAIDTVAHKFEELEFNLNCEPHNIRDVVKFVNSHPKLIKFDTCIADTVILSIEKQGYLSLTNVLGRVCGTDDILYCFTHLRDFKKVFILTEGTIITNDILAALMLHNPNLEVLSLISICAAFSCDVFQKLLYHCKFLKHVGFSGVTQLTTQDYLKLFANWHGIKKFTFYWCKNVTEEAVSKLRNLNPNVEFVFIE